MPVRNYSQAAITVVVDGIPVQGLMEGASLTIGYAGGEVQVTEGTDGPGLNRATRQGGRIVIHLQEGSPDNERFNLLARRQDLFPNGPDTSVAVYSGTERIFILGNSQIGVPGELTTGDKKQAGREYSFVGTVLSESGT